MAVERVSGGSSLIDVLDRILDKGIVIDAWVRISLVGIDLITVEARVVVASIDTYLKYADAVGLTGLVSRPQLSEGEDAETVEVMRPARKARKSPVRRTAGRR
jgi:gas vesicle structural protein